jgi:phosphotransferase system enzyme I (PtsI)
MKLQGVPVSQGIAIAKAIVWRNDLEVKKVTIQPEEVEREIMRLEQGVEKAKRQLAELHQQTREQVGEEEASILFVHLTFLQDPDFIGEMKRRIEVELVDAVTAVQKEVDHFEQLFAMIVSGRQTFAM